MNPTVVLLISVAALLISALDKALTEDVSVLPTLTMPWRAVIAAFGGVVVGACDATVGGALFVASLVAGLSAAAPTLVRLLLVAVLPSLTARLKTAQIRAAKAALLVLVLVGVSATQTGCAGSFEEAKLAGRHYTAATPTAQPTVRCVSLDNAHRTWGGIAEGAAFAAGASGLATIPVDGKTDRIVLASGAVVIGSGAAVAAWVSSDFAAEWVRECSQ